MIGNSPAQRRGENYYSGYAPNSSNQKIEFYQAPTPTSVEAEVTANQNNVVVSPQTAFTHEVFSEKVHTQEQALSQGPEIRTDVQLAEDVWNNGKAVAEVMRHQELVSHF